MTSTLARSIYNENWLNFLNDLITPFDEISMQNLENKMINSLTLT